MKLAKYFHIFHVMFVSLDLQVRLNDGTLFFVFLRFNVPVNNFSVMSGRSHRFLGIVSTFRECVFAQGHNTAEVDIEPPTSSSGVRGCTSWPPRSPIFLLKQF